MIQRIDSRQISFWFANSRLDNGIQRWYGSDSLLFVTVIGDKHRRSISYVLIIVLQLEDREGQKRLKVPENTFCRIASSQSGKVKKGDSGCLSLPLNCRANQPRIATFQ